MAYRVRELAALMLLAILPGCGQGAGMSAKPDVPVTADTAGGTSLISSVKEVARPHQELPPKIIYTGNVVLDCESLDKAATSLEALVRQVHGYVGNADRTGSRGSTRRGSWTIRVPSDRFEDLMQALPSLGELRSSSRSANDVSEEYYDVEARLRNKRIEEARLVELLKSATGKLTEVLTVEKELSRVREEAERIEGRLRYLANRTDLSTVTITLEEVKEFTPAGPPSFVTRVSRTFGGSVGTLKEVATGAFLLLVALIPWIIPIALTAVLARAFLVGRDGPKRPRA